MRQQCAEHLLLLGRSERPATHIISQHFRRQYPTPAGFPSVSWRSLAEFHSSLSAAPAPGCVLEPDVRSRWQSPSPDAKIRRVAGAAPQSFALVQPRTFSTRDGAVLHFYFLSLFWSSLP